MKRNHEQMLSDLTGWLNSLPQHPRGAVRVACIGNSITHGTGIDMVELKPFETLLSPRNEICLDTI